MPIDYKKEDTYSPDTPPVRTETDEPNISIDMPSVPSDSTAVAGNVAQSEPSGLSGRDEAMLSEGIPSQKGMPLQPPSTQIMAPSIDEPELTAPELHTDSRMDRDLQAIELKYQSMEPKRKTLRKPDPWLNIFLLAVDAYTGKPTWLNQILFERPLKQRQADAEYAKLMEAYSFNKSINDKKKEIDIAETREMYKINQAKELEQKTQKYSRIMLAERMLQAEEAKWESIKNQIYADNSLPPAQQDTLVYDEYLKFIQSKLAIRADFNYIHDQKEKVRLADEIRSLGGDPTMFEPPDFSSIVRPPQQAGANPQPQQNAPNTPVQATGEITGSPLIQIEESMGGEEEPESPY